VDPAIEIKGLAKSYTDFELVDVSLTVPRGSILALIGPNGAGKTTILRLLQNLIRPESGTIRLFGLELHTAEEEIKQNIGFAHDVPRYPGHMTVRQIGSMSGSFYRRWSQPEFLRLVQEFDLPLDRRFGKLSRGMKMKTALALALSHDAELLILDEPGSGLDPVFRSRFLELLRETIQDERKSVLFTSQITTDVEQIADYVTYLRSGRVVFSSSIDDIRDCWGRVKGGLELLEGDKTDFFRGCRVHSFGFEALTDDAAEARRRFGGRAVVERASLEDILFLMEQDGPVTPRRTATDPDRSDGRSRP